MRRILRVLASDSGSRARSDFAPAFLDHYFPRELPKEPPPPKEKRGSLERFHGTYFPARSSFSDLTEIGRMVGAIVFRVDADGYLAGGADGEPVRWRQVEPLTFQQVDGKRRIVFREDDRGRIADYCASPGCAVAMQKQPWWESPGVQWGRLTAFLGPLLGGLLGFPIAAVRRRRQPGSLFPKAARLAAWFTCLLWMVAFGIFAAGFSEMQRVVFGPTAALKQFLGFSAAAAVLSAGLFCFTVLSWRNRWWSLPGRICFSLVLLGCAGCIVWLYRWNLLGWNYCGLEARRETGFRGSGQHRTLLIGGRIE